jgi:hypothetical protein
MRPRTFLSFIAVALLSSCSSSATNPTVTTIDPQIAVLQQQLEELKTQVNATTIPTTTTTTTTKAPPYIIRQYRWHTGTKVFDDYECRESADYSDGTRVDISTWWVKWSDGFYPNIRC